MSIEYAALGLLARRPMHGYEIKQAIERAVSSIWTVDIGHLYRLLGRLAKENKIAMERQLQAKGPDRKVYSITPAGRAALAEWLAQPIERRRQARDEFALKLLFLLDGDPVRLRQVIEQQRKVYEEFLAELNDLARAAASRDIGSALLVESTRLHTQADLAWLDRCMVALGLVADSSPAPFALPAAPEFPTALPLPEDRPALAMSDRVSERKKKEPKGKKALAKGKKA